MSQLMNSNIKMTSLDIAQLTGKQHKNVMADIRKEIKELGEEVGQLIFQPSSYINSQNKEHPCFSFGKDGAMQLALKYDAKTRFKVIQRIEELENSYRPYIRPSEQEIKRMNAEARLENARVRKANTYLKLSNVDTLSKEYKSILVAKASETLSGEKILPYAKSEQQTYSAKNLGEMFGVSPQRIGLITNKHNLKIEEYGEWYRDKSRYSSKEIDSFRYFDSVIPRLEEILGVDKSS
ncbi:Rha family transcriptional regulator [Cytobacillus horneckiae]|uniref:Rha family transcriptional regulator n=1 Tax=Cytobacillus horneckiae TaxID=549687 RepID=A0A2N0ZB60_9BACI|nr:Rha family transcriptional regulator [Cytobacillus horneckiae]MEC1155508.1 Rha family transcriptional regulator [Cytobacillus horneckiae]MED2936827.1 Rha family transcriptional regulator [Cytobacillus horneckiae]PKG26752.1 hypothetical protein CWS20_22495 [Cytobacillus horneckiae]